MKKIFTLLVLFVALGVSTANAQYNDNNNSQNETRRYEPGVYQDERGEYRWQTIESRVWIPERRTSGIFGIGARTIPGHYEITNTNRVKVYTADRNSQTGDRGWSGKHPHGMPPGQRKKMQNNRTNGDQRWDDGNNQGRNSNGKGSKKNKNHNNRGNDDRD